MCTGAKPPFDHPHIFIDMGSDDEAICSYCSTRFVYDGALARGLRASGMRAANRGLIPCPGARSSPAPASAAWRRLWPCRRRASTSTIYERAEALEEFGAGLQLTPNATRVLARLGALDDGARMPPWSPRRSCALRGSDDAVLMRLSLDGRRAALGRALSGPASRRPAAGPGASRQSVAKSISLNLGSTVANVATDDGRVPCRTERNRDDRRGRRRSARSAPTACGRSVREQLAAGPARRPRLYRPRRVSRHHPRESRRARWTESARRAAARPQRPSCPLPAAQGDRSSMSSR